MKRVLQVCAAATLAVVMTACALLAPLKLDDDARRAAKVTLTTYAAVQEAALIYGRLKPCDPDPKSAFDRLCRDAGVWAKIKAADKAAVESIVAAVPVLNGERADAGELVKALAAVATVRAAIREANAKLNEKDPGT